MEITNESLAWSSIDEANWDAFLRSQTGQRLIPKLADAAPLLLDGAHANKTLVRNGELRGFQRALSELLSLSHAQPLPPQPETAYPPLEDDKKWSDGETLDKH
jgi:hypothetical protein